MTFKSIFCSLSAVVLTTCSAAAIESVGAFRVSQPVGGMMDQYCFSCHDGDEHKGDIRLDNLESLTLDVRLDLLNRVQEQVYFGEMPPKKRSSPRKLNATC